MSRRPRGHQDVVTGGSWEDWWRRAAPAAALLAVLGRCATTPDAAAGLLVVVLCGGLVVSLLLLACERRVRPLTALTAMAGAFGLLGLAAWSLPVAALLAAVAFVSAPVGQALVGPPRAPGTADPVQLVSVLDDDELLAAWAHSTRALHRGDRPEAVLVVVCRRARLLEEMDRRGLLGAPG